MWCNPECDITFQETYSSMWSQNIEGDTTPNMTEPRSWHNQFHVSPDCSVTSIFHIFAFVNNMSELSFCPENIPSLDSKLYQKYCSILKINMKNKETGRLLVTSTLLPYHLHRIKVAITHSPSFSNQILPLIILQYFESLILKQKFVVQLGQNLS